MFRLTILLFLTLPLTVAAQVVNISDAVLRAAIENDLGKAAGNTITADDMATLHDFRAGNSNISDLTGLEYATNLEGLGLSNNSISDISPLSSLSNLEGLWLSNNSISDLSPLVANVGLGEGDTVRVEGNPLSAESINTHIPTLQARGVEVQFDAPTANIFFAPVTAASVGEIFRLNVVLDESLRLSGWSLNIAFTPPVTDASPVIEVIDINTIFFSYNSCDSGSSASVGIDHTGLAELEFELDDESCYNKAGGALAEILIEAKSPGKAVFNLSNVVLRDQDGQPIPDIQTQPHEIVVSPSRDLNGDGRVDILDLTLVSRYFGQYHAQADVNGDGTVNILDLVESVASCPAATKNAPQNLGRDEASETVNIQA